MTAGVERLSIEGPAGALQAVIEDPGMGGACYAVVCHPHPLFGGTMDNTVVTTVARALQDAGMPTLRFNFRGVGASAGEFDRGAGETEDAEAVAALGSERWPGRSLVIAGFSFGAYVALRLAQRRPLRRLITVAPAIQRFDEHRMAVPPCPWLVIQGDADDLVDPAAVIAWVNGLDPKPRLVLLPGAGHFFHRRLHELRDIVIDAIRSG
ncbi:MAG: alpha/beta family hydrolase [Gammaproteobacteria bacterium]